MRIIKLDRCIAIEEEVDSMAVPQLGIDSIEDVDDLYQAKLEYQWWLSEMINEYSALNVSLGFPRRKLFPKELRRAI